MLRAGLPFTISVTLSACAVLAAREPLHAKHGMVVAQEPLAADAGLAVLNAGGNAVDAAVAVGFTLAVTHPSAGNIGGGGFMLVRFADGRSTFLDFRERAPQAATHDMYLDKSGKPTRDSIVGWRAIGVPGTVRGLAYAHEKWGKLPWRDVVTPAVRLATDGFPVSYPLSRSLQASAKLLTRFQESARIFLKTGYGDTFRQPELAATLTRIRDRGAADFYDGETAHRLAAAMKEHGGLITLDDLKNYRAVERAPLHGTYRGYEITTAPPPSSGGIGILQMLGILEGSGYDRGGFGAASTIQYLAEVMRRYYADRSEYFGDPDFYHIPVHWLLDPAYIAARRATIAPGHATPSSEIGPGRLPPAHESTQTTHFNVVDAQGNAVAVTYTLNNGYGSGVTAPGLGFLLNDEMDDFAAKPGAANMFGLVQGEANAIAPGKRPLSSMTPTIVSRDGKFLLAIGAPGGGRIINGVLQAMLNIFDFHMNPQDAIDAPRIHHQWMPDVLYMERGFSPDTIKILRGEGYKIELTGGVAVVEAILNRDGWLEGATDGRGHGKAAGY